MEFYVVGPYDIFVKLSCGLLRSNGLVFDIKDANVIKCFKEAIASTPLLQQQISTNKPSRVSPVPPSFLAGGGSLLQQTEELAFAETAALAGKEHKVQEPEDVPPPSALTKPVSMDSLQAIFKEK